MKSLSEYLDDNFTLVHKGEILGMLETCQLLHIIDKIILLLKHNRDQSLDIGIISSGLVISVNNNIKALEPNRRQKAELLFADLIFAIFIDFLKNITFERPLILKKIKRHSFITCNLMGYDFNVFKKLIDTCAANSINANYVYPSRIIMHPAEIPKCKLIWTRKGRLEELVYQLAERKLIKNKRAFFDLFLKAQTEHILVRWDFERKGHLAFLLCELYKKDLINITSNRGYFLYAEKHFIGIDGTALKPNSLKKLSSAIHTQPLHYHKIIKDVNEILDKVTAVH
jgi:hypothetical protein